MKKLIICLIFIILSNLLFGQAASSAAAPGIYDYIYRDIDVEELYSNEITLGSTSLILILNKSEEPLASTYYDKDCFYSLIIAKGNDRVITVYNLICVNEDWLYEIIYNINSMKFPTDFKIEDLDYPGKPENTKYYAIDDMSFKIVNYIYDLK